LSEKINIELVGTANFAPVYKELAQLRASMANLSNQRFGTAYSKDIQTNLKSAEASFLDTLSSVRGLNVETVKLSNATQNLTDKINRGRLSTEQYFQIYKNRGQEVIPVLNRVAQAQAQILQSNVIPSTTKGGFAHVITNTEQLGKQLQVTRIQQQLLNTTMRDAANHMINLGKNTQWAGRQLMVGFTVPILASGAALAKMFYEVDKGMQALQRAYGVGGEAGEKFSASLPSADALNEIKGKVQELSAELANMYGQSAANTTGVAAALAAAGYTQDQLLGLTKTVTQGMVLGETDQQSAMKATISLQTAYRLSTEQTAEAMNFFSAAQAATSTTMKDLIEAIPRVGPIIRNLGGSYKDTVAFIVAMKEGGVPATEGANALKNSMQRLVSPTKAASERLSQFGIDIKGLVKANEGNVVGMVQQLQVELGKLSGVQRSQAISELFGKYQAARITALLDNFNAKGTQSAKVMNMMTLSQKQLNDVAQQQTEILQQSSSGKFNRALESFKTALLPIGQVFLDLASKTLDTVTSIINVFQKLGPLKYIIGGLLGGAAIFGPVLMFAGLLTNLMGQMFKMQNTMRMFKQGFSAGGGFKDPFTSFTAGLKNLSNYFEEIDKAQLATEKLNNNVSRQMNQQQKIMSAFTRALQDYAAQVDRIAAINAGAGPKPPGPGGPAGGLLIPGGPRPSGGGSGGAPLIFTGRPADVADVIKEGLRPSQIYFNQEKAQSGRYALGDPKNGSGTVFSHMVPNEMTQQMFGSMAIVPGTWTRQGGMGDIINQRNQDQALPLIPPHMMTSKIISEVLDDLKIKPTEANIKAAAPELGVINASRFSGEQLATLRALKELEKADPEIGKKFAKIAAAGRSPEQVQAWFASSLGVDNWEKMRKEAIRDVAVMYNDAFKSTEQAIVASGGSGVTAKDLRAVTTAFAQSLSTAYTSVFSSLSASMQKDLSIASGQAGQKQADAVRQGMRNQTPGLIHTATVATSGIDLTVRAFAEFANTIKSTSQTLATQINQASNSVRQAAAAASVSPTNARPSSFVSTLWATGSAKAADDAARRAAQAESAAAASRAAAAQRDAAVARLWGGGKKFASGGHITGPGGPRDDVIPALLSNGEYVVNANAVGHYGKGFMESINAKKFASGGIAGIINRLSTGKLFPKSLMDIFKPAGSDRFNDDVIESYLKSDKSAYMGKDIDKFFESRRLGAKTNISTQDLLDALKNHSYKNTEEEKMLRDALEAHASLAVMGQGDKRPLASLDPAVIAKGRASIAELLDSMPGDTVRLYRAVRAGADQRQDAMGNYGFSSGALEDSAKYISMSLNPSVAANFARGDGYSNTTGRLIEMDVPKSAILGIQGANYSGARQEHEFIIDSAMLSKLGSRYINRSGLSANPRDHDPNTGWSTFMSMLAEPRGLQDAQPILRDIAMRHRFADRDIDDSRLMSGPVALDTNRSGISIDEAEFAKAYFEKKYGIPFSEIKKAKYEKWFDGKSDAKNFFMPGNDASALMSPSERYNLLKSDGTDIGVEGRLWQVLRGYYHNVGVFDNGRHGVVDSPGFMSKLYSEAMVTGLKNGGILKFGIGGGIGRFSRSIGSALYRAISAADGSRNELQQFAYLQGAGKVDEDNEIKARMRIRNLASGRQGSGFERSHIYGVDENGEKIPYVEGNTVLVRGELNQLLRQMYHLSKDNPELMKNFPLTNNVFKYRGQFSTYSEALEFKKFLMHLSENPTNLMIGNTPTLFDPQRRYEKESIAFMDRILEGGVDQYNSNMQLLSKMSDASRTTRHLNDARGWAKGVMGFANGSYISGAGGPKDDLIPALLSNGEYVINADAVGHYGKGFIDNINAKKFSHGGQVRGFVNGGSTVVEQLKEEVSLLEKKQKLLQATAQKMIEQGAEVSDNILEQIQANEENLQGMKEQLKTAKEKYKVDREAGKEQAKQRGLMSKGRGGFGGMGGMMGSVGMMASMGAMGASGIGSVASANMAEKAGGQTAVSGALGGAMSGLGIGAMFGPYGMAAGLIGGAIIGGIKGKQEEQERQMANAINSSIAASKKYIATMTGSQDVLNTVGLSFSKTKSIFSGMGGVTDKFRTAVDNLAQAFANGTDATKNLIESLKGGTPEQQKGNLKVQYDNILMAGGTLEKASQVVLALAKNASIPETIAKNMVKDFESNYKNTKPEDTASEAFKQYYAGAGEKVFNNLTSEGKPITVGNSAAQTALVKQISVEDWDKLKGIGVTQEKILELITNGDQSKIDEFLKQAIQKGSQSEATSGIVNGMFGQKGELERTIAYAKEDYDYAIQKATAAYNSQGNKLGIEEPQNSMSPTGRRPLSEFVNETAFSDATLKRFQFLKDFNVSDFTKSDNIAKITDAMGSNRTGADLVNNSDNNISNAAKIAGITTEDDINGVNDKWAAFMKEINGSLDNLKNYAPGIQKYVNAYDVANKTIVANLQNALLAGPEQFKGAVEASFAAAGNDPQGISLLVKGMTQGMSTEMQTVATSFEDSNARAKLFVQSLGAVQNAFSGAGIVFQTEAARVNFSKAYVEDSAFRTAVDNENAMFGKTQGIFNGKEDYSRGGRRGEAGQKADFGQVTSSNAIYAETSAGYSRSLKNEQAGIDSNNARLEQINEERDRLKEKDDKEVEGIQDTIKAKNKYMDTIRKEMNARQKLFDKKDQERQQDLTLEGLMLNINKARNDGDLLGAALAQSAYNAELDKQAELKKKQAADEKDQAKLDSTQEEITKLNERVDTINKLAGIRDKAFEAESKTLTKSNAAAQKRMGVLQTQLENAATNAQKTSTAVQTAQTKYLEALMTGNTDKIDTAAKALEEAVKKLPPKAEAVATAQIKAVQKTWADYTADPANTIFINSNGTITDMKFPDISVTIDSDGKLIWNLKPGADRPKPTPAPNGGGRTLPFAEGGYISGPGTGTSDDIPARLSNGEYVIKADSVKSYGRGMLDAINKNRFASGGFVGGPANDVPSSNNWSPPVRATTVTNGRYYNRGGRHAEGWWGASNGGVNDIHAPLGEDFRSLVSGTVSRVGRAPGDPFYLPGWVEVNSLGGTIRYAHMNPDVVTGRKVRAGESLGRGGVQKTPVKGRTMTSPHLHFAWKNIPDLIQRESGGRVPWIGNNGKPLSIFGGKAAGTPSSGGASVGTAASIPTLKQVYDDDWDGFDYSNMKVTGGNLNAAFRFADGGLVSGPGGGSDDRVKARLSNGEYVMRAGAVKKYGSAFFDQLNSNVGFADRSDLKRSEEMLNRQNAKLRDANISNTSNVEYNINVNVAGSNASADEIADKVLRTIKRRDSAMGTNRRLG